MKTPKSIIQFLKYGIVGVSNTLVTLIVIFLCKDILNINLYISNFIGYVAGLINSFIWNRVWVFKGSSRKVKNEILLFAIGFVICYGIQLLSVSLLLKTPFIANTIAVGFNSVSLGENVATIIAMVIYTVLNFIYNKFITFYKK
ncbi:MAG: GtrA family protein [Bacteroidales bacterium]